MILIERGLTDCEQRADHGDLRWGLAIGGLACLPLQCAPSDRRQGLSVLADLACLPFLIGLQPPCFDAALRNLLGEPDVRDLFTQREG